MTERELSEGLISFCLSVKRFTKEVFGPACAQGGLTAEQFKTLTALRALERTTLKDLSASTSTSSSSLCIMLDRFVREGYALRETDSEDRRKTLYSLSSEGRSLLEASFTRAGELVERRIACLSAEKKESLGASMASVLEVFEEMTGKPSPGL
jgi:DNA-binding MarR family transcriptional regulator